MKLSFVYQPFGPILLPINSGSLGIWLYQVARKLAGAHDVTVWAKPGPSQTAEEVYQGVRYRRVPTARDDRRTKLLELWSKWFRGGKPAYSYDRYYRGYVTEIARELRERGDEVVFLFNFSQWVPILREHNPDIKIVLNMQCEWLSQLEPAWCRKQLAGVDLVLGCSEYITHKIEAALPDLASRCGTVYNGVDTDHFTPSQPDAADGPAERGEQRLIFVGRVSPEKGIHTLIDAMKIVVEKFPEARLDVIGPNWVAPYDFIVGICEQSDVAELATFYERPYHEILAERARAHGLGDRVRFAGALPHEAILEHYRNADVLINPSLSESFGMTLVEAMACGTPVIGTRVGGMPEVVDPGRTGLLVEPSDPEGLAGAICELLADPERRAEMGGAARRRAEDHFSWARIADSLLARYQSLFEPVAAK